MATPIQLAERWQVGPRGTEGHLQARYRPLEQGYVMIGSHSNNDHLIDTIYKCALGLSDWDNVCREIQDDHPDFGIALHLHEARNERNIGLVQAGFDPAGVAPYLTYYSQLNPWMHGMETAAEGALHYTEEMCPREELLRSEFWNDWLKPQGEFGAGSGMVLARAFERHAFIGINYTHKTDKPRDEADLLLRAIGPHLQRAFALWQRAAVDRERLEVFEKSLGTMTLPILIVDGQRRLRFANDGGEAILRRLDGLNVGANREVRAQCRTADSQLDKAIAAVLNSPRSRAPLVVAPKAAWAGEGVGQYVVVPVPVPHQADDLGFGAFSFYDGSLVMLIVHDTGTALHLDPHTLSDTFGLTRTEAELAVAILEGLTLADYAKRKEVSRYTVRNQLSSVMRKTGTHRQADLVRLLTRIATTT